MRLVRDPSHLRFREGSNLGKICWNDFQADTCLAAEIYVLYGGGHVEQSAGQVGGAGGSVLADEFQNDSTNCGNWFC